MSGLRDKPAYPSIETLQGDVSTVHFGTPGMTYREAAALHLMAAQMANPHCEDYDWTFAQMATCAVKAADALIAALEAPDATEAKEPKP